MRPLLGLLLLPLVGLPLTPAASHAASADACSMATDRVLQIMVPARSTVTVQQADGRVRVSGHTCRVAGRPVRVRDLTRVRVVARPSHEVTAETVNLPDAVSWRTDHPQGGGVPRVRFEVSLGPTDLVTNPDDGRSRFDRVVVDGTDGPTPGTSTNPTSRRASCRSTTPVTPT